MEELVRHSKTWKCPVRPGKTWSYLVRPLTKGHRPSANLREGGKTFSVLIHSFLL